MWRWFWQFTMYSITQCFRTPIACHALSLLSLSYPRLSHDIRRKTLFILNVVSRVSIHLNSITDSNTIYSCVILIVKGTGIYLWLFGNFGVLVGQSCQQFQERGVQCWFFPLPLGLCSKVSVYASWAMDIWPQSVLFGDPFQSAKSWC